MAGSDLVMSRLRDALRKQCGVSIAQSLQRDTDEDGKAIEGPPRCIAVLSKSRKKPLQITVDDEVEVRAHGMLLDEQLGTVGLIVVCNQPAGRSKGRSEESTSDIEQAIHDAIHLRQLLRERARTGRPRPKTGNSRTAYNVELVLVVTRSSKSGARSKNSLANVGDKLRKIMARTGFLHAIGVSVLSVPADRASSGNIDPGDLRRAFPWLLRDVRKWFAGRGNKRNRQPATPPLALDSLELRDFRVAGLRKWTPNSDDSSTRRRETLHLIHGQNGSGKSSLTEAIEIALTDKLDRLQESPSQPPDYVNVLTNRQRRAKAKAKDSEVVAEVSLIVDASPASTSQGSSPSNTVELTCRVTGNSDAPICQLMGPDELWEQLRGTPDQPRFQSAGSFRLDQVFSDLLTRSTPADRAKLFMDAFFPGRTDQIQTALDLEGKFNSAWESLPTAARNRLRKGRSNPKAAEALTIVEKLLSGSGVLLEVVSLSGFKGELLSVFPESLPFLRKYWPADLLKQITEESDSSVDELSTSLKRLDDAFEETRRHASQTLNDMQLALPLLESLDRWEVRSDATDGTIEQFAERLNDWLTHHADHDLAEKSRQLVQTRQLLLSEDVNADDAEILQQVDASDSDMDELQQRLERLTASSQRLNRRREIAHQHVLDFRLAGETSKDGESERPHLDAAALAAFDRLFSVKGNEQFSSIVKSAVDGKSSAEMSVTLVDDQSLNVQIGRPGAVSELVETTKHLQAELQGVINQLESRRVSFGEMLTLLEGLKSAAVACNVVDTRVVKRLEAELKGPLADGLNELVALLTPARWAYRDVVTESGFGRRTNQLNFVVPNHLQNTSKSTSVNPENAIPMWLLLNTAELNTFVMSLFLLCGPKLDNPLRLLILDDPFQNMDELTVTTVARGIGRLMRLWDHEGGGMELWNLLILVHGEGTMNRIREEVSCSASYLPWLQPKELDSQPTPAPGKSRDGSAGHSDIETEESLLAFELDHPASKIVIAPVS